jgi:hypothetical protein
VQRLQHCADVSAMFEVLERLLDVHLQHFGDALAFEAHLQRFAVEAVAVADRALHPDVGKKSISSAFEPLPSHASQRPPSTVLKLKRPGLIAARFRFRHLRVELANLVEHFDVGRRVRSRRAADGRSDRCRSACRAALPVDLLRSNCGRGLPRIVRRPEVVIVQKNSRSDAVFRMSLMSEDFARTLTPVTRRTGRAGDRRRCSSGCCVGADDRELSSVAGRRFFGTSISALAREVLAGEAGGVGFAPRLRSARGHDFAAADAGAGAEIDEVSPARIVSSSCSTTTPCCPCRAAFELPSSRSVVARVQTDDGSSRM